jgi:hypothetical protein
MKRLFSFLTAIVLSIAIVIASTPEGNVSFTLRNGSATSIPLKIENVMNPNLSPFSNSGVTCEEGTKIFYKRKGKWIEILVVTPELEGEVIQVNQLLKEKGLR